MSIGRRILIIGLVHISPSLIGSLRAGLDEFRKLFACPDWIVFYFLT